MTGQEYADHISNYIKKNYAERGIEIYREVSLGRTIIGKNRRIDILIISNVTNKAFAIECKFQGTPGTVDEKIPYAIDDMVGSHVDGCICYAGDGFSAGVLHLLEAFPSAAYCMPNSKLEMSNETRDLDHLLAMKYLWWDIILKDKKCF